MKLISQFHTDLLNGLPRNASILDAVRAQEEMGNGAHIGAFPNVLNQLRIKPKFAKHEQITHEIIHLVGGFLHTPYCEQFVACGQSGTHPDGKSLIEQHILQARFQTTHLGGQDALYMPYLYYNNPKDMDDHNITRFDSIYALTLGAWTIRKLNEYIASFKQNPMDETIPKTLPEIGKAEAKLAKSLSQKSRFGAFIPMIVNDKKIEKLAPFMPAELLRLSKAENRAIIQIAKNAMKTRKPSENQTMFLGATIGFDGRALHMQHIVGKKLNENPKIYDQEHGAGAYDELTKKCYNTKKQKADKPQITPSINEALRFSEVN